MSSDMNKEDEPLAVQIQFGGNIETGCVVVILNNCPIHPFGETLAPAFKLTARQAMEIGMNMIHMAKWAEQQEQQLKANYPIAESEADRCTELTSGGQCVLKRGHEQRHMVFQE